MAAPLAPRTCPCRHPSATATRTGRSRRGLRSVLTGLAVLAALVMTSCAGQTDTSDDAAEAVGEQAAEGPAQPETRTVVHALGTTDVPFEPERIVVLWGPTLSALVALGVEPMAAVEQGYVPGVDVPEDYNLDALERVGTSREPDLELIAASAPDLIIGIENFAGERYEELSQLAPTVLFEWGGSGAWKQHFDQVAAAMGLAEARAEVVQRYDQRVAEVREAISRVVGDPASFEVSIVRFQGDELRLESRASAPGVVVDDVGLARPASQDVTDEGFVAVSLERLPDADGDALFVWSRDDEGAELLEKARSNPLWASLRAVQNDAVHVVTHDVWNGAGYLAAFRVLDDLEAALAN